MHRHHPAQPIVAFTLACARSIVGFAVTFAVGFIVGFAVTFAVGFMVGLAVAFVVGFMVGFAVAFDVGFIVGFVVSLILLAAGAGDVFGFAAVVLNSVGATLGNMAGVSFFLAAMPLHHLPH